MACSVHSLPLPTNTKHNQGHLCEDLGEDSNQLQSISSTCSKLIPPTIITITQWLDITEQCRGLQEASLLGSLCDWLDWCNNTCLAWTLACVHWPQPLPRHPGCAQQIGDPHPTTANDLSFSTHGSIATSRQCRLLHQIQSRSNMVRPCRGEQARCLFNNINDCWEG